MKPEGGVTLIIALGGGKPPPNANSRDKGCEMIKLPIEALVTDTEGGEEVAPEIGDTVVLEVVEGEVTHIDEDGTAHVELKTAGGEPIEYAEQQAEVAEEEAVVADDELAGMEAELLAAAAAQDEEQGL